MPSKKHRPEEIIGKLREAEVVLAQGCVMRGVPEMAIRGSRLAPECTANFDERKSGRERQQCQR